MFRRGIRHLGSNKRPHHKSSPMALLTSALLRSLTAGASGLSPRRLTRKPGVARPQLRLRPLSRPPRANRRWRHRTRPCPCIHDAYEYSTARRCMQPCGCSVPWTPGDKISAHPPWPKTCIAKRLERSAAPVPKFQRIAPQGWRACCHWRSPVQ